MIDRVTINDVAKKACVSKTTVSRVLNNFPHIKESTRERVLSTINELGFSPDQIARSLTKKKTKTIGLVVGDISNPFYAETAKVIIAKARELEYDVFLYDTNYSDSNFEKAIKMILDKKVDGMIIASVSRYDDKVKQLYEQGYPIILYNRNIEEKNVNYIDLDNIQGAKLAMKHLVELNHKKVAYISGPSMFSTFYQRHVGYVNSIKEYNLEYKEEYIYNGDFTYEKIYNFSKSLLSQKDRPTAFFAATDQMAIAVLGAAVDCYIRVPKELSVIGFDNISISESPYVGLTTISQQKNKMALLAVEKLILLIEKEIEQDMPIQITLEPKLIVRKTTDINVIHE